MDTLETPILERRWRHFFEKLRIDVIEAQCALESGRLTRASELIDDILRDARRTGAAFAVSICPKRPRALRRRSVRITPNRSDDLQIAG